MKRGPPSVRTEWVSVVPLLLEAVYRSFYHRVDIESGVTNESWVMTWIGSAKLTRPLTVTSWTSATCDDCRWRKQWTQRWTAFHRAGSVEQATSLGQSSEPQGGCSIYRLQHLLVDNDVLTYWSSLAKAPHTLGTTTFSHLFNPTPPQPHRIIVLVDEYNSS